MSRDLILGGHLLYQCIYDMDLITMVGPTYI